MHRLWEHSSVSLALNDDETGASDLGSEEIVCGSDFEAELFANGAQVELVAGGEKEKEAERIHEGDHAPGTERRSGSDELPSSADASGKAGGPPRCIARRAHAGGGWQRRGSAPVLALLWISFWVMVVSRMPQGSDSPFFLPLL